MDSIRFYGELDHKDCDVEDACLSDPSTCKDKAAIIMPLFLTGYHPAFPLNQTAVDVIDYDASWGGKVSLTNI